MTGAELRAHRKAAGLSQVRLAAIAGVGRQTVQYCEAKPLLHRGWGLTRILGALGLPDIRHHYARAGGWGLTPTPASDWQAKLEAEVEAKLAQWEERQAARATRHTVVCGARTRKDTACRNKTEPGRRRCKFHGGKSTGPRTAEGRARIAEAQRKRWALVRSQPPTCL